jgi:hypothetical protein
MACQFSRMDFQSAKDSNVVLFYSLIGIPNSLFFTHSIWSRQRIPHHSPRSRIQSACVQMKDHPPGVALD